MGSRAQLAFFHHHPSFLLARESLLLKEKVPKNVKRPMQAREKRRNSKIPVLLLVKQVPWAVATNTISLAKNLSECGYANLKSTQDILVSGVHRYESPWTRTEKQI